MRSIFSDFCSRVEEKKVLMKHIIELIYSEYQKHVEENYGKIRDLNKEFYAYIEKNWRNCEEMWLQLHRYSLNNFNTNTNNHRVI